MVFTKHIQRGGLAAMVVCRTHAWGGKGDRRPLNACPKRKGPPIPRYII